MMLTMMSPAKAIVMNDPDIAFAATRLDQRPSVRPLIVIVIVIIIVITIVITIVIVIVIVFISFVVIS